MARVACSICTADHREDIEAWGVQALAGEVSWRKATEAAGVYHHTALKKHMEQHYVDPDAVAHEAATDEFAELLRDAVSELQESMRAAPPEVKPLYAVAIQNLLQLPETKGSQQNLIASIKGIHDAIGKRTEQALLLEFAERMFNEVPPAPKQPALDVGFIDVDAE